MSQTSFKVTFTLGYCWAFTCLHSVYPPPPGFIFFTSPRPHHPRVPLFSYQHHHSSDLGPACQIQIYILEAVCCWRKPVTHLCLFYQHLCRLMLSRLSIVHESTSCSQHRCHMNGTIQTIFSYPPALFLNRLPYSAIPYHPFVLPPSPVYKHVYTYLSLISFLPNLVAYSRSVTFSGLFL